MNRAQIHIISTINGQINEGMRNVATHISQAFEKTQEVKHSGLKNVASILINARSADVVMVFARANKQVYWMSRIISKINKNLWIVCVQKPDPNFVSLVKKHPLKANYLSIYERDLDEVCLHEGFKKALFTVGINAEKFCPVDSTKQTELKNKYGIDSSNPLVVHVGHCSSGRGLEDFITINNAERLIVASGMFEDPEIVKRLEEANVRIIRGYMEHVEEIYQMADVYLFPTHSNEYVISLPLSVMEALSCGVPVLGYREFHNLNGIPATNGAITFVDNMTDINECIQIVANKKSNMSYLQSPKTWEQVADDVLKTVLGSVSK